MSKTVKLMTLIGLWKP